MSDTDSNPEPVKTNALVRRFQDIRHRVLERLQPYMTRYPRLTRFLRMALLGAMAILLLWALQKVALMSPSMPIKFSILFGGLATLLLMQRVRMAVACTIILAVFASSVHFTIQNWQLIRQGQVTAEDVLVGITNQVMNNEIAHDLTSIYSTAFQEAGTVSRRYLFAGQTVASDGPVKTEYVRFLKYVDNFAAEQPHIRQLAIDEVANCAELERDCEIFHLLNYVSKEVKYVNDPLTPFDNIQSVDTTLSQMAGDCEDQTLLLMALLESIGIDSVIAFTANHAYPMVCTKERISRRSRYLDREALYYHFDGKERPHCYPLEPTDAGTRIGRDYDYLDFEVVIDPSGDGNHRYWTLDPNGTAPAG